MDIRTITKELHANKRALDPKVKVARCMLESKYTVCSSPLP